MTVQEFQAEYLPPHGKLADYPAFRDVASALYALKTRLEEGHDPETAHDLVTGQSYNKDALNSADDFLGRDGRILEDFKSIDSL